MMRGALYGLLLIIPIQALAESRIATYTDLTNRGTVTVTYECSDFSIPRTYECTSQTVVAKYAGESYLYTANVPKNSTSKLGTFWISNVQVAEVGSSDGDVVVVLSYLDTSGSPSNAEERYEVLGFDAGGKLDSQFGLMTYKSYQDWADAAGLKFAKMAAVGTLR